jgi:hypothetical protein
VAGEDVAAPVVGLGGEAVVVSGQGREDDVAAVLLADRALREASRAPLSRASVSRTTAASLWLPDASISFAPAPSPASTRRCPASRPHYASSTAFGGAAPERSTREVPRRLAARRSTSSGVRVPPDWPHVAFVGFGTV